mgnify:CR=1 FL=1
MSELLALLSAAITAAGALLILLSAVASLHPLVSGRFTDTALDAMRRRFAGGIIGALGLLTGATLLKTLLLESWSALGLFALIFTLRLLIKRSLGQALRPANPH